MPEKPGNGGHGPEAYDPETGQYIKSSSSGGKSPSWLKGGSNQAQTNAENISSAASQPEIKKSNKPKWLLGNKFAGTETIESGAYSAPEEVPIEAKDFEGIKAVNNDIIQKFESYTYEDFKNYLLAFDGEFSEEFLNKLTGEEIEALAIAKDNTLVNANKHFMDKIKEIDAEGNKIWLNYPATLSDLKTSLDKKEEYFNISLKNFQQQIADAEEFGYDISDKMPKLEEAKHYANNQLSKIDKIRSEIIPQWEKAQDEVNQSNNLVAKYESAGNPYSQIKKNQAKWFQSQSSSQPYFINSGIKELYKQISAEELSIVTAYTESYSSINEPLRKIKYYGSSSKQKEFLQNVNSMTSAIDKASLKDDMWFQRGIDQLFIGDNNALSYSTSDEQLKSLIGTTFVDQGFVSCSAHKGGGFTQKDIILNVFAPKKTKALYVAPISHYNSEDEIILQRGYTYRITKVEKAHGKIYIDCDVILGSDVNKYSDKEIELLKNKYFNIY